MKKKPGQTPVHQTNLFYLPPLSTLSFFAFLQKITCTGSDSDNTITSDVVIQLKGS